MSADILFFPTPTERRASDVAYAYRVALHRRDKDLRKLIADEWELAKGALDGYRVAAADGHWWGALTCAAIAQHHREEARAATRRLRGQITI